MAEIESSNAMPAFGTPPSVEFQFIDVPASVVITLSSPTTVLIESRNGDQTTRHEVSPSVACALGLELITAALMLGAPRPGINPTRTLLALALSRSLGLGERR